MFDWTYVENVANAHLCADNSLRPGEVTGETAAAGKVNRLTLSATIEIWRVYRCSVHSTLPDLLDPPPLAEDPNNGIPYGLSCISKLKQYAVEHFLDCTALGIRF